MLIYLTEMETNRNIKQISMLDDLLHVNITETFSPMKNTDVERLEKMTIPFNHLEKIKALILERDKLEF